MDDGFDITFREVTPESGIVELVVAELDRVFPRTGLHCSVVLRRLSCAPFPFLVHVELHGRKAAPNLHAEAIDPDQQLALREAFAALRAACAAQLPEALPSRRPSLRSLSKLDSREQDALQPLSARGPAPSAPGRATGGS